MPIFEFVCTTCEEPFEELVFNTSAVNEINCPSCGSNKVDKQLSIFASRVAGGGLFALNSSSAGSCNTGSL